MWDQLVLSLTCAQFDLIQEADENAHETWKILVSKYKVLDKKAGSLTDITMEWNSCKMDKIDNDSDVWFLGCTGSIRNSKKSTLIMRRMKSV